MEGKDKSEISYDIASGASTTQVMERGNDIYHMFLYTVLLQKFSCQGWSFPEDTTRDMLLYILIVLVRLYELTLIPNSTCSSAGRSNEVSCKGLRVVCPTPAFCLLKLPKP